MAPNFLSAVWHGEAFHRLGVQDVKSLILLMFYFHLMEEGEEKKKRKINHHGVGGFHLGWTHLAGCVAVEVARYN
jgi:hypothetical protein